MIAPTHNGLFDDVDDGRLEVTGREEDRDVFKSSSLRNIAQTGPYMHDGRFDTLEEVVAHYNGGIADHPNLDPALRTIGGAPGPGQPPTGGEPLKPELSDENQAALVAFLHTLTDPTIATEERWSDPFER